MSGNTLLFLDLSSGVFLLIILVAFIIFFTDRIPEIARKTSRTLNKMNCAWSKISRVITKGTHSISSVLKTTHDLTIAWT